MRKINTFLISMGLAILLAACNNALYFYETEKISLSAEARPDSSQPVQGSLGIKQRVALIAPKKSDKDDALSAINSFSFKISPAAGTIFNPVLIQTAFITGDAAQLDLNQARNAAKAITLKGFETNTTDKNADDIVNGINDDDRNTLKQITAKDFDSLSEQDYQNITRITSLVKGTYTRALHETLRKKIG